MGLAVVFLAVAAQLFGTACVLAIHLGAAPVARTDARAVQTQVSAAHVEQMRETKQAMGRFELAGWILVGTSAVGVSAGILREAKTRQRARRLA